jgi:sulfide dehydrogenase cytochrome subunit
MKRTPSFNASFLVLAWMVLLACTKELEEPAAPNPAPSADDVAATEAYSWYSHPGRTLAANCFQCHGTDGFAGELKIAGESYSELMSELNSFRAKDPKSDIMNFHAQAYTADEIRLIADYFSKQK